MYFRIVVNDLAVQDQLNLLTVYNTFLSFLVFRKL